MAPSPPLLRVLLLSAACTLALDVERCKLPAVSGRDDVALGFPRIANRMRTTGVVNLTVLSVDFSDAPATASPAELAAALAPAASYWASLSYGAMAPAFAAPLSQALRMSQPSTAYSFQSFDAQRAYMEEAVALAAAVAGADFLAGSDSVVVLAPPAARALLDGPAFCATPGFGFNVSGREYDNGATSGPDFPAWGFRWANHELGHTMGLVDLYSFAGGGAQFRFTGDWSLMGNIVGSGNEYFGWERWLLGWLGDDEVVCAGAGETRAALAAVEAAAAPPPPRGAPRLLVAPTGATTAVAVEARAAAGGDARIPKPGLLVYAVDTSVQTGEGPLRVLPLDEADGSKLLCTLADGESLVFDGVTVANAGGVAHVTAPCNAAVNCPPPGSCRAGACEAPGE